MNNIIQIGNLIKDIKHWDNPQRGRVYSVNGICPALNTVGGGGLEPKFLIRKDRIENQNTYSLDNP